MATIVRKALKYTVVVGTVPVACIALGYRMRAVQAEEGQEGPRVYRACDLPIYNVNNKKVEEPEKPSLPRGQVGEWIIHSRKVLQEFYNEYKDTFDDMNQKLETSVEHSKSLLDFVQNNEGELPRVAFITVGSLGGFILGYRGSIIRRLIYASVVGVGCAALCYPSHMLVQSQVNYQTLSQKWDEFNYEELMKGNWPFTKDESVDDENSRKLGLPQSNTSKVKSLIDEVKVKPQKTSEVKDKALKSGGVKRVSNEDVRTPTPTILSGDQGQSNAEDKDMYSTRSS